MCGIFACLRRGKGRGGEICRKEAVVNRLRRRGPDRVHEVCIPVSGSDLQLDLLGTLLCMRGEPTPLPLGNEAGDWLLWNGNVFGGNIQIAQEENDTVKVLEALGSASTPTSILRALSNIHGPWSFVFWQKSTKSLWFGRDVFGRRSLLWHLPRSVKGRDCLALSSVGHYDPTCTPTEYWLEVPAVGIFQLHCKENMKFESASLLCYPWMQGDDTYQSMEGITREITSLETCLSVCLVREASNPHVFFPPLNKLTDVDSLPPHSPHSPHSTHSTDTQRPLEQSPTAAMQASSLPSDGATAKMPLSSSHGIERVTYQEHVTRLLAVLESAVQCRVSRAPLPAAQREAVNKIPAVVIEGKETSVCHFEQEGDASCTGDPPHGVQHGSARVAVLYSGGVDSTVLAALVDRCLDPAEEIDLINVAFEQKHLPDHDSTRFDVPDRLSGLASLQDLNLNRTWNFIMVNVTLDEVNKMRSEHISQLVYPLSTVLDDSIGCALWFAARGEGLLYDPDPTRCRPYRSSARTLLVGIGADEQLAGYARHRTKFRSSGIAGVIGEVEMDIKRLAKRNFGRDDRCTADHQRDAQYPFLDEQVVAYLQGLPMTVKADLSLPRGVGEKRLLREVAASLHCHAAAALPKRAIQFGSRMAKLAGSSNSREHGRDTCDRLFST